MIDLESIQPKMRRLVLWLNRHEFITTDSGDGVTNVAAGMEGALSIPHVVCRVEPDKLIDESHRLHVHCEMSLDGEWWIEASYAPNTWSVKHGVALVILYGATDDNLRNEA